MFNGLVLVNPVATNCYQSLPDWFVGFDIYDRKNEKFYSVPHRNGLFTLLGLQPIKPLATGTFSMEQLVGMPSTPSHYGAINIEGIYLRQSGGMAEAKSQVGQERFHSNYWRALDQKRHYSQ